jgi:RNA polymerase sigma-70 factor (ECF subfamily)
MTSLADGWSERQRPHGAVAIQALIVSHRCGLLAFIHARVRAPIDPADILQEIWTKALPAFAAGHVQNEQAYLYGIARNLAAEAMRRNYRSARWMVCAEEESIPDEAPSAHRVANAKDQLRTLASAVGGLPDRCREVFELKHLEHLEKAEIANRLEISTKQVEKQLRQALVRCRSILNRKNSL